MNKGFFVVFLAIVAGAMALIFFNQASTPTSATPGTQQVAAAGSGAETPSSAPEAVKPEPAKPEPAPEAPKPAPTKPEPAKPAPTKPEPVKPEPAKPAPAKPESAKPEPVKPEPAKPEPVKPEATKPAPAKPEAAKPEPAKPTPAKPEPAPPAGTAPVSSKPETPAPVGKVSKSPTLRNIGLHFRGNGMVLRIEANGPFSYKTFALPSPDRYVVDLVGTWENMRVPSIPSNMMIKSARVGKQAGGPRLVLDMQRAPKKHNVSWASPNVLEIYIE